MNKKAELDVADPEQDWEDDLQIVIQNYGVNEFDVPSISEFLQFLPFLRETAKFYGLDSRMQLPEIIVLLKKPDTINRTLVAEVNKLVKLF